MSGSDESQTPRLPEGRSGGSSSPRRDLFKVLMTMSTAGIEMGAAVGIGFGIGHYLDGRWGTHPWLVLGFGSCGLTAAGRALYGLIRRLKRLQDELSRGDSP